MAIILATTDPTANIQGDNIAVSFKSGDETMQVALTLNQAFQLQQQLNHRGLILMHELQRRPVPACAEIIAFPSHMARRA